MHQEGHTWLREGPHPHKGGVDTHNRYGQSTRQTPTKGPRRHTQTTARSPGSHSQDATYPEAGHRLNNLSHLGGHGVTFTIHLWSLAPAGPSVRACMCACVRVCVWWQGRLKEVHVGGRPSATSLRREATPRLEIVEEEERQPLRPERAAPEAPVLLTHRAVCPHKAPLSAPNTGFQPQLCPLLLGRDWARPPSL